MVHIRLVHRKIAALDVAVICCEIERGPSSLIRSVHIGAAVDEKGRKLVMPVIRCCQQGSPSVLGNLIHVCTRVQQKLCGVDVTFTSGKDERCQTTASAA